jgi:hypothetical protein
MERLAMVFLDHSEAYIRAPLQVRLCSRVYVRPNWSGCD